MIKKRVLLFFLAALFCAVLLVPAFAEESRTIRVGYPMQKGFTEIDESGNFSGYSYEYLEEIAQYTGWEYEFIQVSGTDTEDTQTILTNMLKNGQIDLLCSQPKVPNANLSYTSENYGSSYSILYTLDHTELSNTNILNQENLTIAAKEDMPQEIEHLRENLTDKGISVHIISCRSVEEMMEQVKQEKAQCFLATDIDNIRNARILYKFDPHPFYFASSKEHQNMLDTLSRAIASLNEVKPYFTYDLYRKYFPSETQKAIFTPQEKEYIAAHPTLKVALLKGRAPFQRVDEKTGEPYGIAPAMLAYISEQTGLQFEYVIADTYQDYVNLLVNQQVDLAAEVPYQYRKANSYNVALTSPYSSCQIMLAAREGVDPNHLENARLAITEGEELNLNNANMVQYTNIEQCLNAVLQGDADYTYASIYNMQHFSSIPKYRRLNVVPVAGESRQSCVGVTRPIDVNLVSIISKTIRNMPSEVNQSILYQNTLDIPVTDFSLSSFLQANSAQVTLSFFVFSLLVIAGLIFTLYRRNKISRQIALDNERYNQLSELSNEYIFQYDFKKDCLTMPRKSAELFAVGQVQERYHEGLMQNNSPQAQVLLQLLDDMEADASGIKEYSFYMPDGSRQWMRATFKSILNADGSKAYCIGKLANIDDEMREKLTLIDQATQDSLTHLYNAATIRKRMTEYFSEENAPGALFIMDIDHFKQINDHYGHYTGDHILEQVSGVLSSLFRHNDLVGRLGGDEFIALMKGNIPKDTVSFKCHQLNLRLIEAAQLPDGQSVTMSIGVAIARPGTTFDEMYHAADQALYLVKNRGRGGFEIVGTK